MTIIEYKFKCLFHKIINVKLFVTITTLSNNFWIGVVAILMITRHILKQFYQDGEEVKFLSKKMSKRRDK